QALPSSMPLKHRAKIVFVGKGRCVGSKTGSNISHVHQCLHGDWID
ncbi:unnamed protein product, partial [Tilletia caries]